MNFQNIPRQNTTIKRAIVPKLDALACFDYEQIEYRLLAYYLAIAIDDMRMAENFKEGIDPHAATAELIIGHPVASDADRQIGKIANFSIIYAGGVPTIMRQHAKAGLECDRPRAKEILNALHRKMPGIKTLMAMIEDEVAAKGYIYDLFGRHYRPDPTIPYRDAVRKLLNALIQGCAAGLTREAVVKVAKGCAELGLRSHMINVVHDELVLDCVESELAVLAEHMPVWMGNTTIEPVVPITVGMEVARESWADKQDYAVPA